MDLIYIFTNLDQTTFGTNFRGNFLIFYYVVYQC